MMFSLVCCVGGVFFIIIINVVVILIGALRERIGDGEVLG